MLGNETSNCQTPSIWVSQFVSLISMVVFTHPATQQIQSDDTKMSLPNVTRQPVHALIGSDLSRNSFIIVYCIS